MLKKIPYDTRNDDWKKISITHLSYQYDNMFDVTYRSYENITSSGYRNVTSTSQTPDC